MTDVLFGEAADLKTLIIGGGIAGLNCGLRLLQAGHEVTVAEKLKGTIDKVCGEGILPFGVSLLEELGILKDLQDLGRQFYGISYFNGPQSVSGDFPNRQFGLGIDRGILDAVLRKACAQYPNFKLLEGTKIEEKDTAPFDRVMAADGIHSLWAARMGRKLQKGKRMGVRFRIPTTPPEKVQVHFFDNCEVYFTPTGPKTLSVAFLIDTMRLPQKGAQWKNWVRDFFAEKFPHLAHLPIRDLATRAPIVSKPLGPDPDTHLLGDALQAFDPICGAGMSFSLLCGKMAAQHINNPAAYYQALKPAIKSVGGFTNAILFFKGGGMKTRIMMRQLGKAPETFNRILSLHNGESRFSDLGISGMLSFLRI